jgi:hypothetical protein
MRLSEVVELAEFKKRDIVVIGHYDTSATVFAVLARRGEKLLPVPKLHLWLRMAQKILTPIWIKRR